MDAHAGYTVPDVAVRTGLPIPKVRYYAALYGDFLGAACSPWGDWTFRAEHLPFFRALAEGSSPAAALQAVTGAVDPAGFAVHPARSAAAPAGQASPWPTPAPAPTPAPTPAATAPAPAPAPAQAGSPDPAEPSDSAEPPEPAKSPEPPASPQPPAQQVIPARPPGPVSVPGLEERLDELSLQLQDLCEETKQVQILLSQVIGLLQTYGAAGSPLRAFSEAAPAGTASATVQPAPGPSAPGAAPGPSATQASAVLRPQPPYRKWEPGNL